MCFSTGGSGRFEFPSQFLMALPSGFDQTGEKGARVQIIVKRALGVPLDRKNEVIGSGAFQSFDDVVVGTASRDTEAVTDEVSCGLVMARVDGNGKTSLSG
jgi:hypothetical protein